ncbi:MAG: hypothetical protein K2J46_01085 [Muribaculaceae bacterium]|nr:hypothetical protein [Muribaculaceae bacterium]
MRQSLLLIILLTALFSAAKDNIKVKVINGGNRSPIAFAKLAVEYPDTIVNFEADRKGRLSFTPSLFPLTITARSEGMYDATYGFMSMPKKTLKIVMDPDPTVNIAVDKRRVDWSSERPKRFPSTYIVRTSLEK